MSQKLLVNGFKWAKRLYKFEEDFIKDSHKNSNEGYVLETDAEYPKNHFNLHKDFQFQLKEIKSKTAINLFVIQKTKKATLCT